jgi:hypothetical protein
MGSFKWSYSLLFRSEAAESEARSARRAAIDSLAIFNRRVFASNYAGSSYDPNAVV